MAPDKDVKWTAGEERTRGGDILRSRAMWESHPLKDLKNESIKDEILTRESTAQDDAGGVR